MRRVFVLFILLVSTFGSGLAEAQQVKFSRYFVDKPLSVYYYREGNRQHDTVILAAFKEKNCKWAGSLTQLMDPFDNGAYRVLVCDERTGKPIYSRCYSSLFHEYRDTPKGQYDVVRYEEVVNVPMPKRPAVICMQRRDSTMQFVTQSEFRYKPGQAEKTTNLSQSVRRIQYKGNVHRKLDVVIVPEGYGVGDDPANKYWDDADKITEYLFAQEPFKSRRDDFNVWSLNLSLAGQNGVTDPLAGVQVESRVGASFNTFDADRYLMTFNLFELHDLLSNTPCDQIIIMVNSEKYGGGAIYNFYAISSLDKMAGYILPHELGHSIGGLADEYVDEELSYNEMHRPGVEPVEPNITALQNFQDKWENMLPEGTPIPTPYDSTASRRVCGPIGVYEGAGYSSKGLYRPVMHCMMRDYAPFCPVCSKRLNDIFDLYTK